MNAHRGREYALVACIAAGVVLVDQFIKTAVRRTALGSVAFSLPGVVDITHCTNTGVAFSALRAYPEAAALLSAAMMALLVLCICVLLKPTKPAYALFGAMLGGGLGNLCDRLLFGGVTDYIRLLFIPFPVFNFADICVTVSACCLAVLLLTGRLERTDHGREN